jgi:hypothetical protein
LRGLASKDPELKDPLFSDPLFRDPEFSDPELRDPVSKDDASAVPAPQMSHASAINAGNSRARKDMAQRSRRLVPIPDHPPEAMEDQDMPGRRFRPESKYSPAYYWAADGQNVPDGDARSAVKLM